MNYQDPDENNFQVCLVKMIAKIKQQMLNPDILVFEKQLYGFLFRSVKQHEEQIKTYIAPSEYGDDRSIRQKNFMQQLYKSQTQKINYVLKEYLRVRLRKIQKYCFYLYKNQSMAERKLSDSEFSFMKEYAEAKFKYLQNNVLMKLGKNFKGFGGMETYFMKMKENIKLQLNTNQSQVLIPEPSMEQYVFCQIIANPEQYRFNSDIPISNKEDNSVISLSSIVYTQYKYLDNMINKGNAELL